jgi:hypothetical protein
MDFLAAVAGFLKALPELINLWKWLRDQFGDNWQKFITDVKEVTELVNETKDESIPMETKRQKRREALLKGRDLWNRI